jgi:hypothetical protein
LRLPLVVTEKLSGKTPFARAVAGLQTREETADLHFALVALCNRVLAADRLSPSDEGPFKPRSNACPPPWTSPSSSWPAAMASAKPPRCAPCRCSSCTGWG